MKRIPICFALIGCAVLVPAAFGQSQPLDAAVDHWWRLEKLDPDTDWTRHFRVGAMVGLNIKAKFTTSGQFNISGNNPATGIYDDGYVRVDDTGNALGYTSYWGYQSASQLSGTTLTMHSTTSYSIGGSSATTDDSPYLGFDMAYGDTYWYWGGAKLGWELGFGLLPFNIPDNQSMSATVNRSVFTFDTGGIAVPSAPYNGGPSGIGPTIPAARTQLPDETGTAGMVASSRTLEGTLYTLRLGPALYWDLSDRVGLYASAGPAVGLVSGDLNYNESISVAGGSSSRNSGQISGTEMTYGGYVNATLVCHVVEHADFYLGVQYMPMENVTISGSGREGQLDLQGQVYLTAGVNWPF